MDGWMDRETDRQTQVDRMKPTKFMMRMYISKILKSYNVLFMNYEISHFNIYIAF